MRVAAPLAVRETRSLQRLHSPATFRPSVSAKSSLVRRMAPTSKVVCRAHCAFAVPATPRLARTANVRTGPSGARVCCSCPEKVQLGTLVAGRGLKPSAIGRCLLGKIGDDPLQSQIQRLIRALPRQDVRADPLIEADRKYLLSRVRGDRDGMCAVRGAFQAVRDSVEDPARRLMVDEALAFTAAECGADGGAGFAQAARSAVAAGQSFKADPLSPGVFPAFASEFAQVSSVVNPVAQQAALDKAAQDDELFVVGAICSHVAQCPRPDPLLKW